MPRAEADVLVFDVETTGLRKDHDQVIELAVQQGMGPQAWRRTWRFRPTVPIDPAAEQVHGIHAEDLFHEPPFATWAARLHRLFSQAAVWVGYNVGFDIDMLQAEFRRAGLAPLEVGGKLVVDAYRLWQRMEPRGLQQAHQRFVGRAFAGAHRGPGDVAATAAVLGRMIAAFGLEGAGWPELAALCTRREG